MSIKEIEKICVVSVVIVLVNSRRFGVNLQTRHAQNIIKILPRQVSHTGAGELTWFSCEFTDMHKIQQGPYQDKSVTQMLVNSRGFGVNLQTRHEENTYNRGLAKTSHSPRRHAKNTTGVLLRQASLTRLGSFVDIKHVN